LGSPIIRFGKFLRKTSRRHLTLIIASEDISHPRTLRLSYLAGYIFVCFLGLMLLVAGFFYIRYQQELNSNAEFRELVAHKDACKAELDSLANQTDTIALDLNQHIDYDSNIRNIYDLSPISSNEREVGIGGPLEGYTSQFEGPPDPRLERLDKLGRQLMLQDASYTKVSKVAEMQRYIWQHTPSIKPTFGHIVSGFGYRRDPIFGGIQFHRGVDIVPMTGTGTPIFAPADGIVKDAGVKTGYGFTVFIDHGYGFETRYGHCSALNVVTGQEVKRGDIIAFVGATGWATGPHLHYEVLINGTHVNPMRYILPDYVED
jgi:hypothetical protein